MTDNQILLTDSETAALTTLEARASALADPSAAIDTIVNALDYLDESGADPAALDEIHASAEELVESIQALDNISKDSVDLAKSLRQQREEARQALAELKEAIESADTSVPEIEMLWSAVEESNMEWLMYSLFDEWERIVDELINVTPLDEDEARSLISVLASEDLPADSPLWDDLRDWIARAAAVQAGV
jgi:hypothetical protein